MRSYLILKGQGSAARQVLILILLILAILIPLTVFTLRSLGEGGPTGSYLNPLPRGNQVAAPSQSLAFYLSTSQSFLDEARQLANSNPAQTPADKEKIISLLNQALASANQAVNLYPADSRAYQQRAAILFSVAHLDPAVKPLAEQDLATAQSLANTAGQPASTPAVNPLETLPIEQASLAQNVIVANPSDPAEPDLSDPSSNVTKVTVVLPAGQQELKIKNEKLKIDSVIYLIPQEPTRNHPVYVKSKTSASFTLAIDQPLPTDLTIDYWIINQ